MKVLVSDELCPRIESLLPPLEPRRFRFPGRKPLDRRRILTGPTALTAEPAVRMRSPA
ncbi:hypothetical protein BH11PLA2_BH11PLA2_23580 [soil metagenome]